jgi:Transposase and inactivated derivatives
VELKSNNHSKHAIGYHIIFCPKYRHKVLIGAIEIETKRIIAEVCADNEWILHSIEVMPDHVHLFVQTDPYIAPFEMVKRIKSISAVYLFTKFPDLKKQKFWGSGLWSPSTYYNSVGHISEDMVKRYIEDQKNHG